MATCPHCDAELDEPTLAAALKPVCPACGAALDSLDDSVDESVEESRGPGGSPADMTIAADAAGDSSLAQSDFFDSSEADSHESDLSDDASHDADSATLDSRAASDSGTDLTLASDSGPDDTIDFDTVGFSSEAIDDGAGDDPPDEGDVPTLPAAADDVPIAGVVGPEVTPDPDVTIAADGGDGVIEIDFDDDPDGGLLGDDDGEGSDIGSSSDADETIALAGPAADEDFDPEATPPHISSLVGDSGGGSDTSGPGASDPYAATMAFDSERRSDQVETPQAMDVTGLASGDTLPRGELAGGGGSGTLARGASLVVGAESVQLRAHLVAPPSQRDAARRAGDLVDAPDYAIEGQAGAGGMGVVYKARQQSLDRLVALKQIKSDAGASESDRNKFISEAVITGQLEHPNIAPVHDLGLAADGLPFYAMKFVEGEDWEDSIKSLSEEENLAILVQVAQAIAFAHSKNVLHRDLKPGNVRLGSFGEVLVMDWGLAARLDDGSDIQPAGTPLYMPPETALEYLDFAKSRVVGGKGIATSRRRVPAGKYSDIYLLGALLFKIVTGRAPHKGKSTFECLRAAARNEIVKVKRSNELLDIAYKAMATDPDDRHASAQEFIEAIRDYQRHAQSLVITRRATAELRAAEKMRADPDASANATYASYSRAQHGFQNALELWSGNRKAKRRLARALRQFAETAYGNGDFDLTLSLLDPESDEDEKLRAEVLASQKSRSARLAWFRTLQYATAASLVIALGFITYSEVLRRQAVRARADLAVATAEADRVEKMAARRVAAADRKVAEADRVASEKIETAEREAAQSIATAGRQAADRINDAKREAETRVADANRDAERRIAAAEASVDALRDEAEDQAYLAELGRVRATLVERGPYAAWKRLREAPPEVAARGAGDAAWRHLAAAADWQTEATELLPEGPALGPAGASPAFAASPTGETVVLVSPIDRGARVRVYGADTAGELNDRPTHEWIGTPAREVRVAPGGRYVALAGPGLVVREANTGRLLPLVNEVGDALRPTGVLGVAFHPSGGELIAANDDTSVTRYRVESDRVVLVEADSRWHQHPVIAVGYAPDGSQWFSADASGRVVCWLTVDGELQRVTFEHARLAGGSPRITAATLAADPAGRIAYGCDDGAVYEASGFWPAANRVGLDGFVDARVDRLLNTHPAAVVSVDYAEGGTTILSAGGDTLLVQSSGGAAEDGRPARKAVRRYHDARLAGCVAVNDRQACSVDERGRFVRWRLQVAPDAVVLESPSGRAAGVAAVRFAKPADEGAGDARAAVADTAGYVRLYEDIERPSDAGLAYSGHGDHREFTAWLVPGAVDRAVTVAADNRAVVWSTATGLVEQSYELGGRTVVSIDPSRPLLYAASDGRPVSDSGPAAISLNLETGARGTLWHDRARVSHVEPFESADGVAFAVGLRDGQVYLWGEARGRIELARSSHRPHWRPITAIAYDPATDELFTGDNAGLVAVWDVNARRLLREQLVSFEGVGGETAPVERLLVRRNAAVLVVQRDADLAYMTPLGAAGSQATRPNEAMVLPDEGRVTDVGWDAVEQRLLALIVDAAGVRVASQDGERWRTVRQLRDARARRLRTSPSGTLAWGAGAVTRLAPSGDLEVVGRLVSRPAVRAFVPPANDNPSAIRVTTVVTEIGSLDRWASSGTTVGQRPLPGPKPLAVAATESAAFAVKPHGGQRLEVAAWDPARERFDRTIGECAGRFQAIGASGESVAVVAGRRVSVFSQNGEGDSFEFALPDTIERVARIAIDPATTRIAVIDAAGGAWLARGGEAWRFGRLDQDDVASIAFPEDPDRVLLGDASGHVELLRIEVPEGEQPGSERLATRPLLRFSDHSDRVTLLQIDRSRSQHHVVSGDDAGRVVIRPL